MARRSGQNGVAANAADITSDSTIGGPTVEDDLDALDAADTSNNALAIHKATAGEIAALTGKATPVLADLLLAEDSEAADAKRKVTVGAALGAAGQVTNLAAATILITDKLAFEDASDTLAMKEATVQQVFAAPGWMSGVAAATPLAADVLVFEDASDTLAIKKTTIGALPIAAAQVVAVPVLVADDAAAAILNTTNAIYLEGTTLLADKPIADTSSYNGQVVRIRLAAAVLGAYTFPVVGGTLTFTVAGASAVIVRYSAGVWRVLELGTATIAP